MDVLSLFEKFSGLHINVDKSMAIQIGPQGSGSPAPHSGRTQGRPKDKNTGDMVLKLEITGRTLRMEFLAHNQKNEKHL